MNVIATYDYLTSKWAFVTIVIGPGTEKQHCLVKWYLSAYLSIWHHLSKYLKANFKNILIGDSKYLCTFKYHLTKQC